MYEQIRPFDDDEVEGVVARLLGDEEFQAFIANWRAPLLNRYLPRLTRRLVRLVLRRGLGDIHTIREFQLLVERQVTNLIRASVDNFDFEGFEQLEKSRSYLFVSNHRDIAGDSMLLNYALYHSGFDTVRIAVGDNLIQRQFATDLMKLNKSFFIKRSGGGAKQIYTGLLEASSYIHDSLGDGHSVWIAQSEGRTKDGIDETDPAVIKMLALSRRKQPFAEVIRSMNIRPVSLSYEFDPCDELKARETSAIAEHGSYLKAEGEDLVSLAKGLTGYKGRVMLRIGQDLEGPCESPALVAKEIDRQIINNLELFPINYWAVCQLEGDQFRRAAELSNARELGGGQSFEDRFTALEPRERQQALQMYANPVVNKLDQR